jgi:transcriptional regulator with XRE-family HTH domain
MNMKPLYPDWLPPETFGQRVQRIRTSHSWSLQDLAERGKMVKGQISQIENGKSDTSLRYVAKLAHAFGLTPSELLSGLTLAEYLK